MISCYPLNQIYFRIPAHPCSISEYVVSAISVIEPLDKQGCVKCALIHTPLGGIEETISDCGIVPSVNEVIRA